MSQMNTRKSVSIQDEPSSLLPHRLPAAFVRSMPMITMFRKFKSKVFVKHKPMHPDLTAISASTSSLSLVLMRQLVENKILLPYTYIQQVPGKQIRTKLISAFNYWLKVSDEKIKAVGEIVQMLHNSSLLIDDIQDNSILRRGIPVAHSIYGVASTINAANYVMIIALEKSLELGHPLATAVYTEQLLELHRGQGMEIYWRDNFQCPSEEEYKQMTVKKTGGLFMLAIRLMQLFSDNKSDFSKLSAILGLYFQIRDDYCNLCLQEYSENKSFCEDLTEGKFSFPIIHAIRNQEGDNQVLHILRQRTKDVEVKRYCISLLERLGSFQYTRDTLTTLDAEARAEIASLGGNPHLDALLDELLSWQRDTNKNSINVNNC